MKLENKVSDVMLRGLMLGKDTGKSYLFVRLNVCEVFEKHYAYLYI